MKYSAITIQGNILTSDILEKIRLEDIRYQTPKDFGLEKITTLREEIGIAWAAAKAHWQAFQLRRERLKDTDTGTSETRQSWLLPLLRELGYDLEKANAEIINGKSYAISHRAVNRSNFPAHLVGINQSLDKRAEIGGPRLSPHALVQEYLNNQDHLYGLVSNGRSLRLLRDATRLSRLSYLEFDVERILSEDLFAEFALLFRVLHVTRMPASAEDGAESVIEWYHQEALSSGSRIRERLSAAVEESLKSLANGLLKHPPNEMLRQKIAARHLSAEQYYLTLLRCVYRMLFLLVIEERRLVFPPLNPSPPAFPPSPPAFPPSPPAFPPSPPAPLPEGEGRKIRASSSFSSLPSPVGRGAGGEGRKAGGEGNQDGAKRQIYERFYSINRLAQLAEKAIYVDPRKTDLWQGLFTTFLLFEKGYYGEKLGIKPLGSGLFAPDALGDFHACRLDNGTFLNVLDRLVTFENEHGQRVRVNYADLDVEEFGSVYEGLLEYEPEFREINGQPVFVFVKGQARSASGSHYTPEELVKPLIEHSLEYLIQERVKEPEKFIPSLLASEPSPRDSAPSPPAPLPEGEGSEEKEARIFLPSPSGRGAGGEGFRAGGEGAESRGEGAETGDKGVKTGGEGSKEGTNYRAGELKVPESLLAHARELRTNQTPAEELLWQLLRGRRLYGKKFRRQHPMGQYVLDFYCDEEHLAIELDGEVHTMPRQQVIDVEKEHFLKVQRITLLRFWNDEVVQNTPEVLKKIVAAFLPSSPAFSPSPLTPLPKGEGNKSQAFSSLPSPSGRGAGGEGIKTERMCVLQERSLLSIRVADVACGSGHILLSAARRIGLELARVRSGEDQPSPPVMRQAVRDVIRHCIYGVDKNPLAVELCKVALWLEAHAPGEPLNFLDHHIKCGDAIVGLAHKDELVNGIADEAFKTLPGDDKSVAAALAKRNRQERKQREQIPLNFAGVVEEPLERILARWHEVDAMPERTPEEIAAKSAAYQSSIGGAHWWRLKTLADMQTAQFFIPKTEDKKTGCATDADFREFLNGRRSLQERAATLAIAVAQEKRFFHYFLEFPEVLAQGGFDCVLGNPPFLGGRLISGTYGDAYFNYIHHSFSGLKGQADYVGYFFRRIFALIRKQGFQALIATNSISQGDTREGSLSIIQQQGGDINFAVRSMRWPGLAAVEVALVTIYKGKWQGNFVLNGRKVSQLSSYLDDSEQIGEPYPLYQNQNKSFKGSCVYGMGFTMMSEDAQVLILKDHKNKDVLYPFLNGEDVSNRPDQSPGRWVINFFDWEENFCRENYPDCFRIVEKDVKPERTRWEKDKNGDDIIGTYALRKPLPQKWWIYGEKRPKLYSTIAPLKRVLVVPVVSKYSTFCFEPSNIVYTDKLVIFAYDDFWQYALLANSFHHHWAWKYSSTLGAGTLSYSSTDAFETFPFPQNLTPVQEAELEQIGAEYHEFRRQLMLCLQLGLTKLYNQFHNPDLRSFSEAELAEAHTLDKTAFTKRFGKQTWELWSHLRKLPECESSAFARDAVSPEYESSAFARDAVSPEYESSAFARDAASPECESSAFARDAASPERESSASSVSRAKAELSHSGSGRFNAAVADIFRLRELHKTMDETVLGAYGWSAKALLSQPKQSFGTPIELSHSFYEVDYLPENDRIRYTIHPDARKEILKRLLLLNHAIHADEVRQQAGQQAAKKAAKRRKSPPQAEELTLF